MTRVCKWWGLFGTKNERKNNSIARFSFIILRIDPFTSVYAFLERLYRFIPMWWNYVTVDAITRRIFSFIRKLLFGILSIYIYTDIVVWLTIILISILSISRVRRVNPSSGNTGIAYIRRGKLFLELIEYYPPPSSCLLIYLINRILVRKLYRQ